MKKHISRTASRAGFTLLELLIVLAIIVVIAAMVVPNLIGQQDIAKIQATKAAIAGVESSLKMYKATRGAYPEGGDDVIQTLMEPSEFQGQRMAPALENPPVDSWKQQLHYLWPNTKDERTNYKPAIWSNGPDGKNDDGGGDDINNWSIMQDQNSN
jgi:general secretion pathway protein G